MIEMCGTHVQRIRHMYEAPQLLERWFMTFKEPIMSAF